MNIINESDVQNNIKPRLEIGIIGHVDHGKTTLTSTISQVANELYKLSPKRNYEDIDSALEEKQRGITINASHVPVETLTRKYSLVDCPGHQDYMKNMIVSSSMMNGAIVVISLREGVVQQTKEHLSIVHAMGIENLIVYINNKSDKEAEQTITEDDKEMATIEVEDCLKGYGFKNYEKVPIIFGSALKAKQGVKEEVEQIKKILETLDNFSLPKPMDKEPFLMYIGGKHDIKGVGLVVTGIVQQGTLKKNDELDFFSLHNGKKYAVRVKNMQVFNKEIASAGPNEDLAVNLTTLGELGVEEATRGSVLAAKGSLQSHKKFEAKIYLLSKDEGGRGIMIENGYRPQFFLYTADITGEMIIPEGVILSPESTEAQDIIIELERSFPIKDKDKFIIREGKGRGATVGSGFVNKIIE